MKKSPVTRKKFTGNTLVIANQSVNHESIMRTTKEASLKLARSSDYNDKNEMVKRALIEADGLYFDRFKVLLLKEGFENEFLLRTKKTEESIFAYSERERFLYATDLKREYLRGYKNGVNRFFEEFDNDGDSINIAQTESYVDSKKVTWGLKCTNVNNVPYTGKGVKVAILDTGFSVNHPDFVGRDVNIKSFQQGLEGKDVDGHGTHCIGIACGGKNKENLRYGIAYESEIHSAKVLNDHGEGSDSTVIAGIEWAISKGCRIISMSLGAKVQNNKAYSRLFEEIANEALKNNCLILAAAGNDSNRPNNVKNINHPANCPSILSVGAVGQNLEVADFSNGVSGRWESEVDVCAPGKNIYSSFIAPKNHEKMSGTSMATPFVAGIAALFLEKYPNLSADQLWRLIIKQSKKINGDLYAIGSGLVYIN